jgi:hypothetical protein
MIVSSGSARLAPPVKWLPRNARQARTHGHLKPNPENVNETGTPVSEMVHGCEIDVIPGIDRRLGLSAALRLIACRSLIAPI